MVLESVRSTESRLPDRFERHSRRRFLSTVVGVVPAMLAPLRVHAAGGGARVLNLAHLHTGERLRVEYFSGGRLLPDALATVNYFLRDFRTGDTHVIDPDLLDLLHRLAQSTRTNKPFEVISGYRSPATNVMLRRSSEGVAAGSLHLVGQAVDIRLADVRLSDLRNAALAMGIGGVGFYPASNFVHVDTGRPRHW